MAAQSVKTPKTITVAGLEWTVRTRTILRHGGETVDGLCVPDRQEIILRKQVVAKADRTRKVLLHECLHAGLLAHPQYYDETLIAIIEDRVDEIIRLNPQLMEMYGYVQR